MLGTREPAEQGQLRVLASGPTRRSRAGEQAGLDLSLVEAIDHALARAVAAGDGDQDMAATFLSSLASSSDR